MMIFNQKMYCGGKQTEKKNIFKNLKTLRIGHAVFAAIRSNVCLVLIHVR